MSGCELRPHHALCVGFFQGKGYSEAFVENMASVIGALRASDPLLTLRSAADPICGGCQWYGICGKAEQKQYKQATENRRLLLYGASARIWGENL